MNYQKSLILLLKTFFLFFFNGLIQINFSPCFPCPFCPLPYFLSPSPLSSFLFSSHLFFLFKINNLGSKLALFASVMETHRFVSFFRTKLCLKVLVAKLYLTVCDPMDCSPPGSSVHGILQAKILEWVAKPVSPALQANCLLSEPQLLKLCLVQYYIPNIVPE